MANNSIKLSSKIVIIMCGISLIAVLFMPIWKIQLDAPQYPEGLELNIYANKLGGNVDIINGLNHYIGMRSLHKEDFIEFAVLPYIIAFYALLFIVVGISTNKKVFRLSFFLFVVFGIVAMIDFWRWEYNYGHNLNPNAAIIVPGMAYQPPLIGFKQLLNFGAYSIPDIGGWIFIGVGAVLFFVLFKEFPFNKKIKLKTVSAAASLFFITIFFSSCNVNPEPIVAGKDQCFYCKMNVTDLKYGSEIITKKGRILKFDDMHCLLEYIKSDPAEIVQTKEIYVTDFLSNDHQFINIKNAFLFQSDELFKSPMNGNIAAFTTKEEAGKILRDKTATTLVWNDLIK